MTELQLDGNLDQDKIRQEYASNQKVYERLAINLQQALTTFLEDSQVPFLGVSFRVKSLDSFTEKVGRKNYQDPFADCEDLCGIRVICYYPSDVEKISEIIRAEFDVKESIDKAASLGVHEFGYRSTHFVVTVESRWLAAPNYRGLKGVKAEIQVRTILMHAWAEIEHKLAYKKSEDVPSQFRRKLSRLSAKFEEADEQFEELRNGLQGYRDELARKAEKEGSFDESQPLNLDSLRAFLQFYFPDRSQPDSQSTARLLDEIFHHNLTMRQLVRYAESVGPRLQEYETLRKAVGPLIKLSQIGALRAVLDIAHPGYLNRRSLSVQERVGPSIKEFRRMLGLDPMLGVP